MYLSIVSSLKVIRQNSGWFLKQFWWSERKPWWSSQLPSRCLHMYKDVFLHKWDFDLFYFPNTFSIQAINFVEKNISVDMQTSTWKLATSSWFPLTPSKLFKKSARILSYYLQWTHYAETHRTIVGAKSLKTLFYFGAKLTKYISMHSINLWLDYCILFVGLQSLIIF